MSCIPFWDTMQSPLGENLMLLLTLIFGALHDARIFSSGYHGGEVLTHQSTLSSKPTNKIKGVWQRVPHIKATEIAL